MEYGDLYVIPNDELTMQKCFYKKAVSDNSVGIKEFIEQNQLYYQFKEDDSKEVPCILASDGHLVIKTVDSVGFLLCYLPEYMTDNQIMWVYENNDLFKKYSMFCCFQIKKIDNSYEMEKINKVDDIIRQMNLNNIKYHRKMQESGIKR